MERHAPTRSVLSRAPIGVCAWSLRPASPAALVADLAATGLTDVQFALKRLRARPWSRGGGWSPRGTRAALTRAGVRVLSALHCPPGEDSSTPERLASTGGVADDGHWPRHRAKAPRQASLARGLGARLASVHPGRLPTDPDDPRRAVLLERLRALVDVFAAAGLDLALETGQQPAAELAAALADLGRPRAGVNLDPANFVLHGSDDPVCAAAVLAPWVRQVHVKDGRPPLRPGAWGQEVALGEGAVDWPAVLEALARGGARPLALMIERERGEQRVADVAAAAERLRDWLARPA